MSVGILFLGKSDGGVKSWIDGSIKVCGGSSSTHIALIISVAGCSLKKKLRPIAKGDYIVQVHIYMYMSGRKFKLSQHKNEERKKLSERLSKNKCKLFVFSEPEQQCSELIVSIRLQMVDITAFRLSLPLSLYLDGRVSTVDSPPPACCLRLYQNHGSWQWRVLEFTKNTQALRVINRSARDQQKAIAVVATLKVWTKKTSSLFRNVFVKKAPWTLLTICVYATSHALYMIVLHYYYHWPNSFLLLPSIEELLTWHTKKE